MQIHFSQIPEIRELQEKILELGQLMSHNPDDDKTYNDAQQIFAQVEPRNPAQE